MKSRNRAMLEKSISAMIAAIETYNKPDFKYREETFSVLCINSWELLFKAKVLQLASNQVQSLYIKERRTNKGGNKSTKLYTKTNRSGTPMSVSMYEAYRIVVEEYGVKIDKAVKENLETLVEIRDNSIHFMNDDLNLALKIQEIGTAALQNYLHLVREWFGDVLSRYNFYIMPLSFFRDFDSATGQSLNANEKKLLSYIKRAEEEYDDGGEEAGNYNLALKIDLKFQKTNGSDGVGVRVTNDPSAPAVRLAEEQMIEKFPWGFRVLTTRLKKRYSNFKSNHDYHRIRRSLESNKKYCHARLYNPSKPNGGSQNFYNPNILTAFDKHYERS
jgi:hypothetical protein